MANYWSYSKKKLTKSQIRKAHRQANRLMKHKDKIKSPYALAMWQEQREHPSFSKKQIKQIVKDHQKK